MRVLLLIALLFATPLTACLWDYDTLAQESAGLPDVKVVIVGGFARNPSLYYEKRLERVTRLLADNPDDLDAYDGAGVACDRLGRSDAAVEWMAKKLAAMDRIGYAETTQPNHRYRYLANLGTFHAHRWFQNGADRTKLDDLEKARDLVARAIQENPEAHFGREKYQLKFIEWALAGPRYYADRDAAKAAGQRAGWKPNPLGLQRRDVPRTRDNDDLEKIGLEDAVEGFCGLITMGTAWESIDAFHQLALLLQAEGRSAFSYFAMLRVQELLASGRGSIVADLPKTFLDMDQLTEAGGDSPTMDTRAANAEFEMLRAQADQWQAGRTAYMVAKIESGQHPDTDEDFWDDFDGDPEYMDVPSGFIYGAGGFWRGAFQSPYGYPVAIFMAGATIMVAFFFFMRRRAKRRRRKLLAI